MSTTMYTFDLTSGALTGSRPAQVVGGKELTDCANATPVAPPADIPDGHTARWTGSAWEVVEDHRQHMDSTGTKQGGTPYWLPAEGDDYASPPRYMEVLGPLPDGAVTERPEKPAPTLAEAKADALRKVDAATSAAILAGFDYETDPGTGAPETLHFSYDSFDQQNFADSAIAMQLGAAASSDAIPASTPWNAYRNYTPETGGELVVLQLTAATFLPLYAAALTHKATQMAEGSARKALVESADSVEAITGLLERWGL
ncbi:MAG: phage tail protein [Desulfovibrio sp.]|uniref:DUF4376 domain-containing protein n=1 Tax=Desulfovibrio sp. TaxID=885 RepID=UPI0025835F08|nr:phage tail protein [Desulfovibrio sp.]MCD7985083.1 phage tail protein [Desulfovibrio sp.]